MAEYIEREAAIKAVCDCVSHSCDISSCGFACSEADALSKLPAANVRPVLHGKWEHSFDEFGEYYKCSNCGKEYFVGPIVALNFCAYCGADMRGGEAGE
jgi:hypothetical protein